MMATSTQELQKKEATTPQGVERTKPRTVYAPAVDILERKNDILITADMPGVDDQQVDITLDKDILTVIGTVGPEPALQHRRVASEYGIGDFQRAFVIGNEIDRDHIEATVKNGVLQIVLPKAQQATSRKIDVRIA
ncbi:MAG: Hsp20/alpha crystallin family protein [Nitrospiraceae bacterium]|nr:Hsp20/alpha crystallin family protein [Nitrospiraceae bacterium]